MTKQEFQDNFEQYFQFNSRYGSHMLWSIYSMTSTPMSPADFELVEDMKRDGFTFKISRRKVVEFMGINVRP